VLRLYFLSIFPNFCNHQIVISSHERSYIKYTQMPSHIYQYVINCLWVLPSGEVQVYLWMFRCGNIVLLRTRFVYVANFTILKPLSVLSWCKLSFSIVGLKIFFLPSFALKSPNRIFIWCLGIWWQTCSNSSQNCLLSHHFSPHLVHVHSKLWYYTSDLSDLYMKSYHQKTLLS